MALLEVASFLLMIISTHMPLSHGLQNEDCIPFNVHLSVGSLSSEMVVMWSTSGSQCESKVHYSTDPWKLANEATGESRSAANKPELYLHRVVLKGLSPGVTHYYRPMNSERNDPYMFKAPESGNAWSPKFLVLSGNLSPDVLSSVKQEERSGAYTALLYTNVPQVPDQKEEEKFVKQLSEAATSLPLVTSAGTNSWSKVFSDYLRQQPTSGSPWPSTDQASWYSVDIGPVHLISYSTAVFFLDDLSQAKSQQAWLVDDLTAANKHRNVTPWIIAIGNQPMYCLSGPGELDCATNTSKTRHGLEDLFYHFAVDLVLESVPGSYQRNWPQYKGVKVSSSYTQPSTPVEIMLPTEKINSSMDIRNRTDSEEETPEWSAFHLEEACGQSYGLLSVVNSSHLHWQLISAQSSDLLDEIWLHQDQHGNFSLASLPHNISHQINRTIIAMGGKPGTYDFIGGADAGEGDQEGLSKYSLWIGLAIVAAVLLLVLGLATLKSCFRRKKRSGRRWQEIDRDNTSGKFYSVASDSDTDDNDFEINMYDKTNKQSSKLLTSY